MLLSICIPTYNRSGYLRKTLESIVSQDAWAEEETEIVISDNASTDGTQDVIREFSERFPERIRGKRQDRSIHTHLNFEEALRLGGGDFLKLNNDTLAWREGALGEYLSMVRPVREKVDLILTPNCRLAPAADRRAAICRDLDEVISGCSYFLTWIGMICFRRETFLALPEPSRYLDSRLTQTDMVLRLAAAGGRAMVDGRIFFDSMPVPNKTPKSLVEVFSVNFLDMLSGYVPEKIGRKTFRTVKKQMFHEYIIPVYFDFFRENPGMERPGYWQATVRYHREFYFYTGFFRIAFLRMLCRCFSHETLRWGKRFFTGRLL